MAFSLFGNRKGSEENELNRQVRQLSVSAIIPNRFQPRQVFDPTAITELAQTIQEHGLLQPIVVREYEADRFEIIAGERRFRAVNELGWTSVSAIVEDLNDDETASMALIENLQREQLSAVEEADAYHRLMTLNKLTQTELASAIGKSQSFVANKLRLLKLTDPVKAAIMTHQITERHGRALLRVPNNQQAAVLDQVIADQLTVKESEQLIDNLGKTPKKKAKPRAVSSDTRVAVNTIQRSVKMVTDAGIQATSKKEDHDEFVRVIIDIPKQK
ncbi:nucleoid occlusion protein [Levilactobacillus bambusae]|uniref:Nucleoid occlusion protein n=1 Tax=Levilactobacillus bambusae TaxID=2024736 RepID=A0A2V1MXL6_9LACO|nr:nucleoid occlusion protein [Levilactobacillus bambusae]PWF99746.1 nucleoid occlusion protein [Levilactobacillus bambusae]